MCGQWALLLGACASTPKPVKTAKTQPAPKVAGAVKTGNAVKTVKESAPVAFDSAPAVGTKAKCPVSGEVFTVTDKSERAEVGGKHYAFCCPGCKGKFTADPAKFLTKK